MTQQEQAQAALERVIMHAKTQAGSFCSMDEYKQNEADCLLLRAALEAMAQEKIVDVKSLLRPTKQTDPFLEISARDIYTFKSHGWNECLIYLLSQSYLKPLKGNKDE